MRVPFALAALLLLASCGAPAAAPSRPAAAHRTPAPAVDAATPVPQTPAPGSEQPDVADRAPEAAAAQQADDPYPDVEPGQTAKLWGDMQLDMTLEPACATAGTQMKAVIRTVPDALVGGAVRYADNDPHGDLTFGRTPTGEHVWTWVIKPDVPKGVAEAMVTAGKKGESGAAAMAAFEVAETC